MQVTLQVDNHFGDTGPQSETTGLCLEIRKIDRQFWAYCVFPEFGGTQFICELETLLIPYYENTETYWRTI